MEIETIEESKISEILSRTKILFVTATDTETECLHRNISPLPSHDKIIRCYSGNNTYYIGLLGVFGIVHVQCSMGTIGESASTTTTQDAI